MNLANTLTRRREPYHEVHGSGKEGGEAGYDGQPQDSSGHDPDHAPSIHDLEETLRFTELPPVDPEDRAILVERVIEEGVTENAYRNGSYPVIRSWATEPLEIREIRDAKSEDQEDRSGGAAVVVHLQAGQGQGEGFLEKTLWFREDGTLTAHFCWDPSAFPENTVFTTEISLGGEARVTATSGGEIWRFPIATFSKSERGFDETVQGESVLVRWPVTAGEGRVRIGMR